MKQIYAICIGFSLFYVANASFGDASPYYQKCTERCHILNCTEDGLLFLHDVFTFQSAYLGFLRWSCIDECKYECMWKTVAVFLKRNWSIPQFYGKWPFTRILGLQEPASVLFSLINLYVHYVMNKKFRKVIDKNYPMYWLWYSFFLVCCNAWIWSAIFHARDTNFTEFMDYSCAFSMVLIGFYCMIMRIGQNLPIIVKVFITSFHGFFFVNHVLYLSFGQFDYGYNMAVNVLIGSLNAIIWFSWCVWNRNSKPHVWKCAGFVTLAGLTMALEVFDFPPIFWTLDSHSLWHFSSALITPLFYRFMIDDCQYLKALELEIARKDDQKNK